MIFDNDDEDGDEFDFEDSDFTEEFGPLLDPPSDAIGEGWCYRLYEKLMRHLKIWQLQENLPDEKVNKIGVDMAQFLAGKCVHCGQALGRHSHPENSKLFECQTTEQVFKMPDGLTQYFADRRYVINAFFDMTMGCHPEEEL